MVNDSHDVVYGTAASEVKEELEEEKDTSEVAEIKFLSDTTTTLEATTRTGISHGEAPMCSETIPAFSKSKDYS